MTYIVFCGECDRGSVQFGFLVAAKEELQQWLARGCYAAGVYQLVEEEVSNDNVA